MQHGVDVIEQVDGYEAVVIRLVQFFRGKGQAQLFRDLLDDGGVQVRQAVQRVASPFGKVPSGA